MTFEKWIKITRYIFLNSLGIYVKNIRNEFKRSADLLSKLAVGEMDSLLPFKDYEEYMDESLTDAGYIYVFWYVLSVRVGMFFSLTLV